MWPCSKCNCYIGMIDMLLEISICIGNELGRLKWSFFEHTTLDKMSIVQYEDSYSKKWLIKWSKLLNNSFVLNDFHQIFRSLSWHLILEQHHGCLLFDGWQRILLYKIEVYTLILWILCEKKRVANTIVWPTMVALWLFKAIDSHCTKKDDFHYDQPIF